MSPITGRTRCLAGVISWRCDSRRVAGSTVLNENIQALLDQEGGIEDDQTVAEGQHVVAGADFEELTDGSLQTDVSDWRGEERVRIN